MAASVAGCSTGRVELGQCWSPAELKLGTKFSGEATIMAGIDTRPLMSPVTCEGTSVIAKIPDGSLGYNPNHERDATEPVFFRARVEGVVDGTAQGRPMVNLNKVNGVVRIKPSWLKNG